VHNVACEYIGIDDLCNMNLAVYTKREGSLLLGMAAEGNVIVMSICMKGISWSKISLTDTCMCECWKTSTRLLHKAICFSLMEALIRCSVRNWMRDSLVASFPESGMGWTGRGTKAWTNKEHAPTITDAKILSSTLVICRYLCHDRKSLVQLPHIGAPV